MLQSVRCMILRGGTSRGLFFLEEDIPPPGPGRDRFLLAVMGSPDIRQIDGLGGAVSTTSKVAIVSRSSRPDADVEYTFAQVSVDKPVVDYKGNCGNISSAVGPFALEAGLAAAGDPETIVRVHNTNTDKVIYAHLRTPGGKLTYEGDFSISGVPGTAAPVKLAFRDPAGSVTGRLLPTGNAVDALTVPGLGSVTVSIVDAANPLVFARAEDLGLRGDELPEEIDGAPGLLGRLESVRGAAALLLGLVEDPAAASTVSPAVPKMTLVAKPMGYRAVNGDAVESDGIDLTGRMMSMQKTHKTYALTGALCTAAAMVVEGSLPRQAARPGFDPADIRIGHPGGIIRVGVDFKPGEGGIPAVEWAYGFRTARLIMRGTAYYRI